MSQTCTNYLIWCNTSKLALEHIKMYHWHQVIIYVQTLTSARLDSKAGNVSVMKIQNSFDFYYQVQDDKNVFESVPRQIIQM